MSSKVNFQGLATGLNTSSLIEAILEQESAPLTRMQERQTLNNQRSSLLRTFKSNLMALNTSLSTLNTSAFESKTVTSTDPDGTHVTASANQDASGSYDVTVSQTATKARLGVTKTVSSSTGSLGGTKGASGEGLDKYAYTVTNRDGEATTFYLSEGTNTLAGLRDAINAQSKDTGVSASIVQVSATGNSFQLVLNATETGLGSASGALQLATNAGSALGGDTETTYTSTAEEQARNALFTVNGVQVERASNTVSDVVEGMTFTLKKGDGGSSTTNFSVSANTGAISTALQDVVTKFNALYKVYKDNSDAGEAFAGDSSVRSMLNSVRTTLTLAVEGVSEGNSYRSAASLGLKTNRDGTMSLDSSTLKTALEEHPADAAEIFGKIGTAMQTLVTDLTSSGSGSIALILQGLDSQNSRLNQQIEALETRLERRRTVLETQYGNLEATISQLQSAGQSLSGLS